MNCFKGFIVVFAMVFLGSCSSPEVVYISNLSNYPLELVCLPQNNTQSELVEKVIIKSGQTNKYYLYQFVYPSIGHELFVVFRKGSKYSYILPRISDPFKNAEKYSHGGRFRGFVYLLKIDNEGMYVQTNEGQWIALKQSNAEINV